MYRYGRWASRQHGNAQFSISECQEKFQRFSKPIPCRLKGLILMFLPTITQNSAGLTCVLSDFLFYLERQRSLVVQVEASQLTSEPRSSIFESLISYCSGFVKWAIVINKSTDAYGP